MTSALPKGYKKTEIGVIPEGWKVEKITENSILKARIGWQGLTTAEYLDTGKYYLITGTDFENGRIKWETCHFVEKRRFDQDKNIQIKKDDILITKDGTIGKVAYIDKANFKATLNSGVFVIRPINNKYYPLFTFYIFNSKYFSEFLRQLIAGSTINHLYQKDFVNFKFPLPPLPEQTAIATVLSDTDKLIRALEKQIAKKRLIKQGAMQELLKPKEGWVTKKLGEVAEIVGGGTPSTFVSEYWNGDINWFTPSEIGKDKYLYNSIRKITQSGLRNCSANILPKGTILLTSRAGIGDIGILKTEACTNQGFQSLIVKSEYDNEFFYYLLSTLKSILLQNASGSTFLEISPNKVKSIQVIIPNKHEQTRIATILSDMDTEIEALENKLEKYRKVKQGMMQVLLTGKIRLI